ncbi:unnamed protein product, partial [Candidula unifasciata]
MERQLYCLFRHLCVFVTAFRFHVEALLWNEVTFTFHNLTPIVGNDYYVVCELHLLSIDTLNKFYREPFVFLNRTSV